MINQILGGRIIIALLVTMEVALVLGPPTYTPKNTILVEKGSIEGFINIRMSAQHNPWVN